MRTAEQIEQETTVGKIGMFQQYLESILDLIEPGQEIAFADVLRARAAMRVEPGELDGYEPGQETAEAILRKTRDEVFGVLRLDDA